MIGKFKTPEALLQSYECLEREFTKKCQRIKELEEQIMEKKPMYEQTDKAFDCCVFKKSCKECPLRDYGVTQLDCKTKLLEDMKDYVMQLVVDKECAQRDANNFERTLEECNEERQGLEEELQNRKVYELKIDWANNDAEDCATTIYATEEKARIDYLAEIRQAKADYSQAFNEDGTLDTGSFGIEEGDNYWQLYEKGYWSTCHCLITLTEKEVL